MDLAPLRQHRDFRLLWIGQGVTFFGSMITYVAVWGLAILGFSFSSWLWLALVFLALAGAADMISGVFRMTIWNTTIPDSLRGRLAGIELISYSTGPTLGNVEAGGLASLAGRGSQSVSVA